MKKDKEFRFSVTSEGDSVVQEDPLETSYPNIPKYFGEYTEAIKYMEEEIKKFINNKPQKTKVKEVIATVGDWYSKLDKPCQSMWTDFGNPMCRKQFTCFILNDNFTCPEGRTLKEK